MLLKTYLRENKLSQRDFAARIGSSQGDVSRWTNGVYSPQVRARIRIQKATRGKVRVVEDWPMPPDTAAVE